jgi:hypothetical protein
MLRQLNYLGQIFGIALLLAGFTTARAEEPAGREALWKKLEPFAQPPEEFAGKFGLYRSPLKFADNSLAKTPADWARRREEIQKTWHKRLGAWPALVEKPTVKKLETIERDGYTQFKVQVQIHPDGKHVDGYLLVPTGRGPFPAVLVPFYEPLTSIGQGAKGRGVGTHDYGLQLVKRGFVTLSIGTPGSLDKLGGDTRDALVKVGQELRRQPLTLLAYVASNCLTALAQLAEVDPKRIGIIGLSYGGKWSMFASCLDERFACAVWSDPGIVFNEKDANCNYWEPWYLGYDPKVQRKEGIPSTTNPRTGLYKELLEAGEDLVDLHALMAPRPVLVSGGVQDPPRNWQALNHLVAVNTMLGHKNRAFLTKRKTHVPTAEALELELVFLEYFLKPETAAKPEKTPPQEKEGKTGFTLRSVKGGPWSAPETWDAKRIPREGDRVLIGRKTRVLYDVDSPAVIRYLQVAGVLSFARDRSTTLNVGVITIQASEENAETSFDCHMAGEERKHEPASGERAALEVGTSEDPIPHPHTARIRLHLAAGIEKKDGPAIVCCDGRMDFHGAVMNRTWLYLAKNAGPGDTGVVLSEAITGWRIGDEVLVTGVKRTYASARRDNPDISSTETRRITKIDGRTLQLDKPLAREHLGEGEFRCEIANLSRNVIIESADPKVARGHTMYHRNCAGGISYARFAHLGQEGMLGRYPIHYHLCGATMRGSSVIGAAIVDSHNRWVTIHGTHFLVVRDCVGYQSIGHGFFLEDATEVYNLLDRNLGVQAYRGKKLPQQALPFDPNDGAAFWWSNGRNSITRNAACENEEYGYRYDIQKTSGFKSELPILMPDGSKKAIDVRTIPIFRFDDNIAHTEGLYGMVVAANGNNQPDMSITDDRSLKMIQAIDWTGPDTRHPHAIRNLTVWNAHYAFRPHSPSMLMENIRIHNVGYGVYRPTFDNQVFKNLHLSQSGAEPFNRGMDDASCQAGSITVDGLRIDDIVGSDQRHPAVHMTDNNLSGKAECHFRNVVVKGSTSKEGQPGPRGTRPAFNRGGTARVDPIVDKGVPYYIHDHFGPGRHAKIISTKAADLLRDGNEYRKQSPLTGDESVVAEVMDVAWPKLLDQVDDLPPATIILSVRRQGDKLLVKGVSHDNGVIRSVTVNGQEAKLAVIQSGLVDWTALLPLPKDGRVTAAAVDEAGNRETLTHVVFVKE